MYLSLCLVLAWVHWCKVLRTCVLTSATYAVLTTGDKWTAGKTLVSAMNLSGLCWQREPATLNAYTG